MIAGHGRDAQKGYSPVAHPILARKDGASLSRSLAFVSKQITPCLNRLCKNYNGIPPEGVLKDDFPFRNEAFTITRGAAHQSMSGAAHPSRRGSLESRIGKQGFLEVCGSLKDPHLTHENVPGETPEAPGSQPCACISYDE
jgi:hypothetical protein